MLLQLALAIGTLIGTVFVLYWLNGQRGGRHLPPGPKKLPLIGSLVSMPSTLEWETFARWGKEYSSWLIDSPLDSIIQISTCADSDIIHVNALGTSMVILNSYKVATDLLEERSSNYSSRYV